MILPFKLLSQLCHKAACFSVEVCLSSHKSLQISQVVRPRLRQAFHQHFCDLSLECQTQEMILLKIFFTDLLFKLCLTQSKVIICLKYDSQLIYFIHFVYLLLLLCSLCFPHPTSAGVEFQPSVLKQLLFSKNVSHLSIHKVLEWGYKSFTAGLDVFPLQSTQSTQQYH